MKTQTGIIRLRGRATLVALLVSALFLVCVSAASAYPTPPVTGEPFTTHTCAQCHADNSVSGPYGSSGPHRNYSTTTNKCALCHTVHNAPAGGTILLPKATVTATCLYCHDGTQSGIGPYNSITAHAGAGAVQGEHTVGVGATSIVPGGTEPLDKELGCSHCHAVHGAKTVAAFLRDTGKAGTDSSPIGGSDLYVASDCLLRNDLNGAAPGAYPEYGAQWCAACHDQRHSASGTVQNHPVENNSSWGYGDVVSTLSTPYNIRIPDAPGQAVGLGRTNSGYIMAPAAAAGDGRIELADRRAPMCQQCHEDARDVETIFSANYTFRLELGDPPFNPEFVTFPHQTTNLRMTVETFDDLCTNCHPADGLP